jgi:hypothetical protein
MTSVSHHERKFGRAFRDARRCEIGSKFGPSVRLVRKHVHRHVVNVLTYRGRYFQKVLASEEGCREQLCCFRFSNVLMEPLSPPSLLC